MSQQNGMRLSKTMGAGLVAVAAVFSPFAAAAEGAKDLVGTWTLVSVTYEQDGKTTEPYGAHPKGQQILTADGHMSVVLVNSELPKFASGSRLNGTAQENQAVVQGSLAYFGTYTATDTDWTVKIEGSTFPNWFGLSQSRNYTITGDELTITNHGGASGSKGASAKVVWKRAQ